MYSVYNLPKKLLNYSNEIFNELLFLSPKEYSKIIVYNTEKITKRYNLSYLNTPKLNKIDTFKYSYMFSGKINDVNKDIPDLIKPFLDFFNTNENVLYNQVTINWFFNPEEYIPYHSDCDIGMVEDSNIIILSLGSTRTLNLKKDSDVEQIKCENGTVVVLKNQKKYKHKLCKTKSNLGPRISISFRKYI